MPAFRYCQDNRPVVEYLRNRNRTVLSDVFQSRGLTSKQNCRSLFAYAVIRPRRAKEPFNAVIEGEDDRPVQAAASWFLRQVTGAGPVSQSFDKSMDVGGDGKIWNVPCEGVMPNLEFHFPGGAVGTIIGSHLIAGDDGDGSCRSWLVVENSLTRGSVGGPFFTSNYLVFDQASARISWAPQA